MAFVDEDQGVVLLGQLADLPQGRDVTVHGEGTIGGHQPQAVFLPEGRVARCEDVTLRNGAGEGTQPSSHLL